jgi:hypothetical protein
LELLKKSPSPLKKKKKKQMSQIKVQNKDLDALQDKDESVDEGDS